MAILVALKSPYMQCAIRDDKPVIRRRRVHGTATRESKTRFLKASHCIVALAALGATTCIHAATPKTSGVYLTAADYSNQHLAFEGDCRSKAHRLALHDVLNKPYIDVTHESEKHRYAKSELFGFRSCDGHDYRFSSKLEYQILEARELYIYSRDVKESRGKGMPQTIRTYYFSAGADAEILPLTLENLKRGFPENHKFHDLLDANFGAGQDLEEYDGFHKMFKVNRLLIASKE